MAFRVIHPQMNQRLLNNYVRNNVPVVRENGGAEAEQNVGAQEEELELIEGYSNGTALHTAAQMRNPKQLSRLLDNPRQCLNINKIDSNGRTPLQVAMLKIKDSNPNEHRHLTAKLLLKYGADPTLPSCKDNSLVIASRIKCHITLKLLYHNMMKRGPEDPPFKYFLAAGWPIMHFVWVENLVMAEKYVERALSSPPKERSLFYKRDTYAWHCAVLERCPMKVFKLLATYKLDCNCMHPASGDTPLHWVLMTAKEWKDYEAVALMLLELGANPNILNSKGQNCLHLAASVGSSRLVDLMLKKNVDTQQWDSNGRNALHFAAMGGCKEIIAKLHSVHKLSVTEPCRSCNGESALHLASQYSRPEAVLYLIRSGANPNQEDLKGRRPLDYAVMNDKKSPLEQKRCAETVDTLVELGASLELDNFFTDGRLSYCLKRQLTQNAKALITNLAIKRSQDPKILAGYMSLIEHYPELEKLYNRCLKEVEETKKYELFNDNWGTIHTILTATEKVIKPLTRNPDVVKTMYFNIIHRIIDSAFPIYGEKIIRIFTRCETEHRRFCFACDGLRDIFGPLDPTGIIADKVVSFMGNEVDELLKHKEHLTKLYLMKKDDD